MKLLHERLDYYETVHTAQCECWKKGHHENLKYCTCEIGRALKVLETTAAQLAVAQAAHARVVALLTLEEDKRWALQTHLDNAKDARAVAQAERDTLLTMLEFCSCGHRRATHHEWGRCHGERCKCTKFILAEGESQLAALATRVQALASLLREVTDAWQDQQAMSDSDDPLLTKANAALAAAASAPSAQDDRAGRGGDDPPGAV